MPFLDKTIQIEGLKEAQRIMASPTWRATVNEYKRTHPDKRGPIRKFLDWLLVRDVEL